MNIYHFTNRGSCGNSLLNVTDTNIPNIINMMEGLFTLNSDL